MKNRIKLIILSILLGIFWLMPVQAQEAQENDGVASVVTITPKAGHEKELIEAITDYHHYVAKHDGHFEYNWYEIETGPDTGKYIAHSGGHNWSDYDAEYDWQKEAGENFAANVAPHIESTTRVITVDMDEFSHWPENFEGYTHYNVENWYVKNGQYGKFRAGLKKIHEILTAGNYAGYYGFNSAASGGYGNQIHLVSANKGWSGMADKDPSFFDMMTEALGGPEEFQAFMSDWAVTFKTGHSQMVSLMPEASDYGN
jgi:hypothetical protein